MKSALLGRESPLPLLLPFSSVVVVILPHIHNPYPKPTSTMMTNTLRDPKQAKQKSRNNNFIIFSFL
jgi:hypothetical protein